MSIIQYLALSLAALLWAIATPGSAFAQNTDAAQKDFEAAAAAYQAGQFKQAYMLLAKVCYGGVAQDSYNLGTMLYQGEGGSANPKKSGGVCRQGLRAWSQGKPVHINSSRRC